MRFRKERKFYSLIIKIRVAILGISLFLCTSTSFGGNTMEFLYDINEASALKAEEFNVKGRNLSIFPAPQDNSVGTNDIGNAITLLSFHKTKVKQDTYFRNAAHDFEGGGTYLPVIDEDTIGFAQSRRFLMFDFKSKDCRNHRIVMSIDKTIRKAAIADRQKKHFIFEIKEFNQFSEDHRDYTRHLLLMDLSGEEATLIKKVQRETGTSWSIVDDKLFIYARKTKQLRVLNMLFETDNHPLADIIKANKEKIRFTLVHYHPYLPFAILSGGRNGAFVVNWGPDREKVPHLLFKRAYRFSFSPDGKWVVFENEASIDTKRTYLMPVSEKYPNYLGSPILLANDYFDSGHFAWTTNPISFVGSSLSKLYRWELTNEAHPESDKPTFHNYIVERDLERLTREKKQGLDGTSE